MCGDLDLDRLTALLDRYRKSVLQERLDVGLDCLPDVLQSHPPGSPLRDTTRQGRADGDVPRFSTLLKDHGVAHWKKGYQSTRGSSAFG